MECMLLKKVFWVGISVLNGGLEKVIQQPNQEFDISTMMAYSQVDDALPTGRVVLFLRKGGQRGQPRDHPIFKDVVPKQGR